MRMEKRGAFLRRAARLVAVGWRRWLPNSYPVSTSSATFGKSQALKGSFIGWLMVMREGLVDGLMVMTVASLWYEWKSVGARTSSSSRTSDWVPPALSFMCLPELFQKHRAPFSVAILWQWLPGLENSSTALTWCWTEKIESSCCDF